LVVVGGGLVDAGEALLGPTRRALAALVEGHDARSDLRLVPAGLGARAGAVGAALLGHSPPKSFSTGGSPR
jgi:glucokinase